LLNGLPDPGFIQEALIAAPIGTLTVMRNFSYST